MADGVLALSGLAAEGEHPPAEIGRILMRLHQLLSFPVPNAKSRVSPGLIDLVGLRPFMGMVRGLESELNLQMLIILANAGVASEFETGVALRVPYPDRLTGDPWGTAMPDFYHRRAALAIFCDSELHHASREARGRDNGVSSALLLRGIKPIRFTSHQILHQPLVVGRSVLAHLGRVRFPSRAQARPDAA